MATFNLERSLSEYGRMWREVEARREWFVETYQFHGNGD